MNNLLDTYAPLNIKFTHGEGCWLWDKDGNRYLDAISGLGVNILGYGNSEFTQTIQKQAEKLIHLSNLYEIDTQQVLAQELCNISKMDKAFFCVSGAEAIECAIKLARLYGQEKQIKNPAIIVCNNAYHGRTLATITASGQRSVQAGFEPLVPGFVRAPFNDISALQHIAETRQDIVGVMIEPIQGSGGIHAASLDYLKQLRNLCDRQDWLYIADEIQCGAGRTGEFLYSQHANVHPDIVALAKGLGNGIPIGVCLTRNKTNNLFTKGKHGSTFGGSPLSMTAGISVLKIMEQLKLIQNAKTQGQYLIKILNEQFQNNANVTSIRGKGLMIGIELKNLPLGLPKKAVDLGILINITAKNVIRLLPPLIINNQECNILAEKLDTLISDI
tara:strand:+ start:111823 stop:112986 length:1164 start_codon:yes stop_codon:yes gene_type:complete